MAERNKVVTDELAALRAGRGSRAAAPGSAVGCLREVQGYYASHAVPAGDMAHLLRKPFLFPPSVAASPVPVA